MNLPVTLSALLALGTMSSSSLVTSLAVAGAQTPQTLQDSETANLTAVMKTGKRALDKGDFAVAVSLYREAQALALKLNKTFDEAACWNNLGLCLSNLGRREEAVSSYRNSIAAFRRTRQTFADHPPSSPLEISQNGDLKHYLALALGSFAQQSYFLNNERKASPFSYREALPQANEALSLYIELNNIGGAQALLDTIDELHRAALMTDEAIEHDRFALELKTKWQSPSLFWSLYRIGQKLIKDQAYDEALLYFARAQDAHTIHQANNPDPNWWHYSAGAILHETGVCQYQLGEMGKALASFQQALQFYRQMEVPDDMLVKITQGEIAAIISYQVQQNALPLSSLPLAEEYTRSALQDAVQNHDDPMIAQFSLNLAAICVAKKDFVAALPFFQQAEKFAQDAALRAKIQFNRGILCLKQQEPALAETHLHAAIQGLQQLRDPLSLSNAHWVLANLAVAQDNPQKAETNYQAALKNVRMMVNNPAALNPSAQIDIAETAAHIYGSYTKFLLGQGRTEEAFAQVQSYKGQTLLSVMGGGRLALSLPRLLPEEKVRYHALRKRVETLNHQFLASLSRPVSEQREERISRQKEQALLTVDWERFENGLYAARPELRLKPPGRTATITELVSKLGNQDALLEYVCFRSTDDTHQDRTYLFCLSRHKGKPKLQVYRVQMTQQILEQTVERFARVCADSNGTKDNYSRLGNALYRAIIAPASVQLAGKTHLILCPDSVLWNVPFAALWTDSAHKNARSSSFLVEQRALSYNYSATIAAANRKPAPANKAGIIPVFAVVDPDFGPANRFALPSAAFPSTQQGRGAFNPDGSLIRLPETRRETQLLKQRFKPAQIFEGNKASEEAFRTSAPYARILHFGTHGFFNNESPLSSSIILAQPGARSSQDGVILAREILEMPLNAELAVLGACETARGEIKAGEGLLGLVWSLFAAGVSSQIVSQFSVPRQATPELISSFYTELLRKQEDVRKDEALRRAQRALLAQPRYRNPYYWCAWQVFGNTAPLSKLKK